MTTHALSVQPDATVIRATPAWVTRNARIFATQDRARKALDALRLAYETGAGTDTADRHAHDVTDALAELSALALHVEDDQ